MEFPKSKHGHVDNWFLMSSPVPIFLIWISYLAFVLKIGPAIMKNRRPFKLKNALLVYNAFQVCYSVYIVFCGLPHLLKFGIVHRECVIDENQSERENILRGSWFYFFGKLTELFDTIFFVLRKKSNQVTFLHVYHHSIMLILSWLFIKYIPTDSAIFLGTLNSFVHVVMYTYYGLSSLGPEVAKYLTWKKYITTMQLTQFAGILVQLFTQQYLTTCKSTTMPVFIISIPNLILFLYLFGDFYKQSYTASNPSNGVGNGKSSMNGKMNGKSSMNGKINGEFSMNGISELNGTTSMNGKSANGHYRSKATKLH